MSCNCLFSVATIDKPKKQETQSDAPKAATPQKLADLEAEITKCTAAAVETYNNAINAIRGKPHKTSVFKRDEAYIFILFTFSLCPIFSFIRPSKICSRAGH